MILAAMTTGATATMATTTTTEPKRRLLLALPLLAAACGGLPVRGAWVAQAPPANGPDPITRGAPLLSQDDVDLWASNDGHKLYLTLSSVAEHVKDQWMGVYGQSLLLFFDPGERHPDREGLRLTLSPPAGLKPPWDPRRGQAYVLASADRVERVRRARDGQLEDRPIRPQDVDWEIHFEGPRLVYRLTLPLTQAQGWNLGLKPGRRLGLHLETTAVDPRRAMAFSEAHLPPKLARFHSPTATASAGALSPSASLSPTLEIQTQAPAPDNTVAAALRQRAAQLAAMDPGRLSPANGDGPAVEVLPPNPPPNQVPDPLDISLRLQLAAGP